MSVCVTATLLLIGSRDTTAQSGCHISRWTKRRIHRGHCHCCSCCLQLCCMVVVMASVTVHAYTYGTCCGRQTQIIIVSVVTLHILKMMHLTLLFMLLLCLILTGMVLLIILLLL